jgi:hypothetical protein
LITHQAKRIKADRGLPADGTWSVNLGTPYMVVPRKARFGGVKFQRVCSLTSGLFVQDVVLLALMAFASKAPIWSTGYLPKGCHGISLLWFNQ